MKRNFITKLFGIKSARRITVLSDSKTPKYGFKTLDPFSRTERSEDFWNDRGRFYDAIFERAERKDSGAVKGA
ncbi:MAG: hypothetical protein IJQ66_02415 [Clostridia bacterium]|nr:hypothetical protein [Clostridia bacterium]